MSARGGFAVCCRGASVACVGVGGPPAAWHAAAALALAVALWMRSAGRGGSEEEVEDVNEDEDEEEVWVLGDAGCAAMRAGVGSWAAAAPEGGHGGVDGGHVPRPQLGGGWFGGARA